MLQEALGYIRERGLNVSGLTEIAGGREETVRLRPQNRLNNVYSVSKTVTATAIAMLEFRGLLTLADPILPLLKKRPANLDPRWETVHIENLLSHTWGQRQGDLFEADRYTHGTDDWLGYILEQPLTDDRVSLRYSNASYYLLSLAVERITSKSLFNFLRAELFVPLGFEGHASGVCPMGHTLGATEFFLRVEDMAKLGKLYLDGGLRNGTRFFAEDWARRASRPIATDGNRWYGYSFWRNEPTGSLYYADGANGQLIAICPERESVLAMQSYDNIDFKDFLHTVVR